jgi:hypothetical protein
MRRVLALVVLLSVMAFAGLFVLGPLGEIACASTQVVPDRMAMRLLLVSTDGEDDGTVAWRDLLGDEGVPFDELHLSSGDALTDATLRTEDGGARYQAIVLGDTRLAEDGRPDLPSLLTDAARGAIDDYQRATGARVVGASIVPDAALPVTVPRTPSDLDGLEGRLTSAGRAVFGYLRGPIPIEDAFGFVPDRPTSTSITVLAALPDGRPLVFVSRGAGGTETLYVAPQVSPPVLHWRLLRHGLLGWATGGVHLGLRQLHFAMQIDDVYLPNFRWDPERNQTRVEAGTSRMSPDDVAFASQWIRDHDLRIDLAFNAAGRTRAMCETLLHEKDAFGWISHTYSHRDLDDVSTDVIVDEIERNRRWGDNHDLPGFRDDELVTGAHTGLENPNMPDALERTDIDWIASDASRELEQRRLGPARTVPRYPTDIYYDASTRAEELDEYDHAYLEDCDPSITSCRDTPASWDEFVSIQAEAMFRHIIDGDPRTHYAHQSNLTDDRILFAPLEAMLDRYAALVDAPLLQPTLAESGEELRRQAAWATALQRGDVEAWLGGGAVHVLSAVDVDVPITGASDAGPDYAGEPTGWVRAKAGTELVVPI